MDTQKSAEVAKRLVSETHKWIDLANQRLNIRCEYPTILTNLRGTCAGKAFTVSWIVQYNLGLALENEQEFFATTVPHEVAHLVADQYYGKKCMHGPLWKNIMEMFGVPAVRCHNYDVTNHRVRKAMRYIYRCSCLEGCTVGPKYHKKLQLGLSTIYCRRCEQVFTKDDLLKSYAK
jgi:SprT protein